MPFLERTLPSALAHPAPRASATPPGQDPPQDPPASTPPGPVRTQMVGESPEDDLGYDPRLIPTEPIPDED